MCFYYPYRGPPSLLDVVFLEARKECKYQVNTKFVQQVLFVLIESITLFFRTTYFNFDLYPHRCFLL